MIDLSSRTDGIVDTIDVERGDIVAKDQVVVRLEDKAKFRAERGRSRAWSAIRITERL